MEEVLMPMIAEIKNIEGQTWVRLETVGKAEGMITLWDSDEINNYKRACVRDFLMNLFDQWKDRNP
jgi:hypothetical protein